MGGPSSACPPLAPSALPARTSRSSGSAAGARPRKTARGSRPLAEQLSGVFKQLGLVVLGDVTVQVAASAWKHGAQQRLNATLADTGAPLIAVATAEPCDASHLTGEVHLAA